MHERRLRRCASQLAIPARHIENYLPISKPEPKRKKSRFRRILRRLLLLIVLALLSLLIPPVFRGALRQLIALEGWRHGVEVTIGEVEGSLYEPVVLRRSHWTFYSRAGSLSRFEVARAEAAFSWQELLPGRSHHWFRRLSLDGVVARVELPPVSSVGSPLRPQDEEKPSWYPAPTRVEATDVDLQVESETSFVRLLDSRILISEQQPGFIEIGRLILQQPILSRTFHNIHGTTALQDGRVEVAGLQLDAAVQVQSFSADVREIARGRLDMDLQMDAFGGKIHAQAETIPHERGTELEASGNFTQIDIAPLASFLGITEAAGGKIKEGKFNFRGSPRDLLRSSVTLRLEATNFQWESRQWDSLILGATFLDRRAQIPELELRQGHNQLSLKGEMALPAGTIQWWQSDFNFDIDARIENLTELSALLLPDFRYAAGRMRIKGSLRSKDQQYDGQLIASGSDLTWRSAPIQELRAAVQLSGKELQIASLDLLNKEDYLRAQGVINLDDARIYHGELRALVEDLSPYASILQKPLVPDSLAGGATLRWMGEGSTKGQSGRFFARLRHLRPLTPAPSRLHPVDAELEGSYAPASLQFSKLYIADESCALAAQVEIAARSVNVSSLHLTHGDEVWLEGQALLPLEVWSTWREGELPKLADEMPIKLHLKAVGLQLATAARLTGWNWPIAGAVDGELTAAGKLGALQGEGKVHLQDGRFPLEGDTVPTFFSGDLLLAGQVLTTDSFQLRKGNGHVPLQARLDLASFHDPLLSGTLGGPGLTVTLPFFSGVPWSVRESGGSLAQTSAAVSAAVLVPVASLQIEVAPGPLAFSGPLSAPTLSGSAEILGWNLGGSLDVAPLWEKGAWPELPAAIRLPSLLAGWKLKVSLGAGVGSPLLHEAGTWVYPQLLLTGTGALPVLGGTVQFGRLPAQLGALPGTLAEGSITFREGSPRDPTVDLHATGLLGAWPFNAWVVGPLSRRIGFFDSEVARATALDGKAASAATGNFPPWAVFSGEASPPAKTP